MKGNPRTKIVKMKSKNQAKDMYKPSSQAGGENKPKVTG